MRLNNTTQKAKNWIFNYKNSDCYSVEEAYSRPSTRKLSIEENIKKKMWAMGGHSYKVLGANSSFFTCGYLNKDCTVLYIETAYNTFEIEL